MTSQGHEASSSATRPVTVDNEGGALTRRELRARERATGSMPAVTPLRSGAASVESSDVVTASAPAAAAAPGSRRALREAREGASFVRPSAAQPVQAPLAEAPVLTVSPAAADEVPVVPTVMPTAPQPSAPTRTAPRAAEPRLAAPRASVRATARARRAAAVAAPVVAPRRSPAQLRGQRTRRFGVLGAMVFVGATIVATSVPANAYFVDTPENVALKLTAAAQSGTTVGGVAATGGQQYVASGAVSDASVGRDGYSVTNLNTTVSSANAGAFTNDSTAAVQWPFATGVPISSGFGARQVANCGFCSTFHQGLDFIPGAGTPIQIVADGVVSKVEQGGGALGYNVWIEHTINGQQVTSVYAHMVAGSIKVTQGETVKVGQQVGNVGSTGNSTGAHLHFEIHLNGVPVDPYPWLMANAGAA